MSYEFYKWLHLASLGMLLLSVGGIAALQWAGHGRDMPWRRGLMAFHGVALLVMLVSGFGLIAKLGIGWPTWVFAKVAIWLCFGALAGILVRLATQAKLLWTGAIGLVAVAAWLAIYKPF